MVYPLADEQRECTLFMMEVIATCLGTSEECRAIGAENVQKVIHCLSNKFQTSMYSMLVKYFTFVI